MVVRQYRTSEYEYDELVHSQIVVGHLSWKEGMESDGNGIDEGGSDFSLRETSESFLRREDQ